MKGLFRKSDFRTLVADDARALDALAGVSQGGECLADVKVPRNPKQHRLFWALVELVGTQRDTTKEATKDWLMLELQYFDLLHYPNGVMAVKPKSISYESMPQAQFREMFRAAVPVVCAELGNAPEEIQMQLQEMLDPGSTALMRQIMSPPLVPSHSHEYAEAAE
jgi:hypothetical protein